MKGNFKMKSQLNCERNVDNVHLQRNHEEQNAATAVHHRKVV
jgi:hypothetical protein